MTAGHGNIPPVVLMMADHLDAALAHAEDLRALRYEHSADAATPSGPRARTAGLRDFVELLRRTEALLVARVLTARQRLAEIDLEADEGLKTLASLFVAGTAALVDAVAELHDATLSDFDTGDSSRAYLTQRAVRIIGAQMSTGEDFLVARRIHLGALMDLVAAFLDALDARYDLYPEAETIAAATDAAA